MSSSKTPKSAKLKEFLTEETIIPLNIISAILMYFHPYDPFFLDQGSMPLPERIALLEFIERDTKTTDEWMDVCQTLCDYDVDEELILGHDPNDIEPDDDCAH
jgi:hypothetical protein